MTEHTSNSSARLTRIYFRSMLLTALGTILLYAISDQSFSFFLIGTVGVLIGCWYASQGPSGISRLSINAVLAVVIVIAGVNILRGNFSVESFAFFSLLLLILKFFDLRSPRDHGQILVLSLALIISAALTSNTMLTGVLTFFMGFVFIRAMMIFRLFALIHDRSDHQLIFSPNASIDLRSIQTATGFVCVVVALLIFLVMPRSLGTNSLGQWGGAGDAAGITTGFTDSVQLGRPGRISTSPTPILRMAVVDRNDKPIGSDSSRAIYLRGSVLNQYQSGRWVVHSQQSMPVAFRTRVIDRNQTLQLVRDDTTTQWTHEYRITFDYADQNYGYLFTPWKPLELKPLLTGARIGTDQNTRMILLASNPVQSYSVRTSDPEFQTAVIPEGSSRMTVDPAGVSQPIIDLAYRISRRAGFDPNPETRPLNQDYQVVRALENHLRTQFTYTLLSEPVPPGRDATEWFLFDRQTGHCEYYASALTLMARAVGIPARVITGYVAAEYNDVTETYTVRESNAHAWVEAMVAPDFWRTFDGTPQSDFHEIHEPEPTFMRSISKFYEALEHTWIAAFIGYDSDSRSTVFGDLDSDFGMQDFASQLQSRFAAGRTRLVRQALITGGIVFVVTMVFGLALVFLIHHSIISAFKAHVFVFFALGRQRRVSCQAQLAAAQLVHLIHKQLAATGMPCPKGLPLRMHLSMVTDQQQPELIAPLDDAVGLLYRNSFTAEFGSFTQSEFLSQAQNQIKALKALR